LKNLEIMVYLVLYMSNSNYKIIVAITGASGSVYAKVLLDKLLVALQQNQVKEVGVVMSGNAQQVWQHELLNTHYTKYPFIFYDKQDFGAPFASGSANFETMIICPCSMGTLGRIAHGISNDLITRAADVILKERRKLILIARETPLSSIHLQNMLLISQAGGIICPATPSFYSLPQTIEEVAATVVDRALNMAHINTGSYQWGQKP
jgi:4-hydroxy-3-polyprenylbenzoate decarboxylase